MCDRLYSLQAHDPILIHTSPHPCSPPQQRVNSLIGCGMRVISGPAPPQSPPRPIKRSSHIEQRGVRAGLFVPRRPPLGSESRLPPQPSSRAPSSRPISHALLSASTCRQSRRIAYQSVNIDPAIRRRVASGGAMMQP